MICVVPANFMSAGLTWSSSSGVPAASSSFSSLVLTPSVNASGVAIVTLSCYFYREDFVSIWTAYSSFVLSNKKLPPVISDSLAVLGSSPDAYRRYKTTFTLNATNDQFFNSLDTFPPTPRFSLVLSNNVPPPDGPSVAYYPVDTFAGTVLHYI